MIIPIKPNLAALRFVTGVISQRTTLPILGCVLLKGSAISATNLDVTLFATLETGESPPGDGTVIDGKLLMKIAEQGRDITIEGTDKSVVIVIAADGLLYKLRGLDPAKFPPPPKLKNESCVSVPASELAAALRMVESAVSTDDSRYALCGVFFEELGKGRIAIVATDGRRLHKTEMATTHLDGTPKSFILPSHALPHLFSLLAEQGESQVRFEVDPASNHVRIEGERLSMISRTIEASFPHYRNVIPDHSKAKTISVDVPAWIAALEAVVPLAYGAHQTVKLSFSKESITFFVSNDGGEATATIKAKCESEIQSYFDPFYILDVLRSIQSNWPVEFRLTTSLDPCTVTTPAFTAVIMPKRRQ